MYVCLRIVGGLQGRAKCGEKGAGVLNKDSYEGGPKPLLFYISYAKFFQNNTHSIS